MSVYGIIPARLESTRLPRKLLLNETGKPLIQHTWEAACRASVLDEVIVATDSEEIAAAVRGFGGRVEMTGEHSCGTDRIAEVARRLPDAEIVVNVQGDEPEIDPRDIQSVAELLRVGCKADISTLARRPVGDELDNPNRVKVVIGRVLSNALYFSRSPLVGAHIHCGIYAFLGSETLQFLSRTPAASLEMLERLEQLRAVEHGIPIVVCQSLGNFHGIDTPEDYVKFVERQEEL